MLCVSFDAAIESLQRFQQCVLNGDLWKDCY